MFTLRDTKWLDHGACDIAPSIEGCTSSLLAGLVTSADTGNEDLVVETRAALAELCDTSDECLRQVCGSLLFNLKQHAGEDRVLVPTLEVVAYLFHIGLLQRCLYATSLTYTTNVAGESAHHFNLKQLCLLVQKAAYKTGNVRKLEACIKVYGAIAAVKTGTTTTTTTGVTTTDRLDGAGGRGGNADLAGRVDAGMEQAGDKRDEGIAEARRRLGALLLHPWPRIRSFVVDELWNLLASGKGGDDGSGGGHGVEGEALEQEERREMEMTMKMKTLLGVDWGKADKTLVKRAVRDLGLE